MINAADSKKICPKGLGVRNTVREKIVSSGVYEGMFCGMGGILFN